MKNRLAQSFDESTPEKGSRLNLDAELQISDDEILQFMTISRAQLQGLSRADYKELLEQYHEAYHRAQDRRATLVEERQRFERLVAELNLDDAGTF